MRLRTSAEADVHLGLPAVVFIAKLDDPPVVIVAGDAEVDFAVVERWGMS